LESYCFNLKSTVEDDKVKDKIPEEERKTVMDKCEEVIKWLDANQLAEKEEFEDKQKELEKICNPIITKRYAASGGVPPGAPGGPPGGFPGAGAGAPGGAGAGGAGGPTIEEVD
jgi:L1 cell adhesion molecule like protein